jgi:hypothetical protein
MESIRRLESSSLSVVGGQDPRGFASDFPMQLLPIETPYINVEINLLLYPGIKMS